MATKKNYAQIAAESMYRPADEGGAAARRKPKILCYARNKKGKSTFAASAHPFKTLFADPEWGVSKMVKKNPHTWPIKVWSDMDNFYKFCRAGGECPVKTCEHRPHGFDWAAIDGMTKLSNMSLKHVMKIQEERDLDRQPGMVQQRDYGRSGELMKDMMSQFHNLDMGVIYTAQERQDAPFTGDDDDEDVESATVSYVPDMPKGVRAALTSNVEVIGRLYVVRVDKEGVEVPQRRLWIGPSMQYDTGYRSDYVLPDVIKAPTIPKLVKLMSEGPNKKVSA